MSLEGLAAISRCMVINMVQGVVGRLSHNINITNGTHLLKSTREDFMSLLFNNMIPNLQKAKIVYVNFLANVVTHG